MPPIIIDSVKAIEGLVGKEVGPTDWLTITQERIAQFAKATEDRQWIHVDPERARRESPFGTTVAHGFLTLSLASYFAKQAIEIRGGIRLAVNYGLNRVRFIAPVPAGAKIRARFRIESAREIRDRVEVVWAVEFELEGLAKPCCVAEWIVCYFAS
jgi:acyl dehydratase